MPRADSLLQQQQQQQQRSREIKIYVVRPDREEDAFQYDVSTSTTVGDLKAIVAAEANLESSTFHLVYNQNTLVTETQTLGDAGIANNDFLSLVNKPSASGHASESAPAAAATSSSRSNANTSSGAGHLTADMQQQIESFRQRLLTAPDLQADFRRRAPDVIDALHDSTRFRDLILQHESQRQAQQDSHYQSMARLNEEVNEENQAKIEEMIRLERIDAEMEAVMTSNPELFGRVTMLYVNVEVNGHPIKAFVDSGAQATIMSADCAERCNITRLIDSRWAGMAKGVGTAKILGRVHRATVKIGFDELPCAFTVMEGKDVDMLLGLDMLKRYQACIDLSQNKLVFPGGQAVEFLPEHEIPRGFDEAPESASAGPGANPSAPPAGAIGKAAASGFQGAGRTLGSAGAGAGSSLSSPGPASAQQPLSSAALPRRQGQPPAPAPPSSSSSSSSRPEFPQEHIDALVSMGATREQAVMILRQCGGNVELAASALFDQF